MSPSSRTVTFRNKELCVHSWSPPPADDTPGEQPPRPSAAVCVVYHGFRAHGLYPTVRYAAERLASAGYEVLAPDLPGHGRSGGKAGYLPGSDELIDDCVAVAEWAKNGCGFGRCDDDDQGAARKGGEEEEGGGEMSGGEISGGNEAKATMTAAGTVAVPETKERKKKLFLLGSSMGGAIALSVAQRMPKGAISGAILLAPMLRLSVSGPERYLLRALSAVASTWEVIPSSSTDASKQYRNPERRRECEEDEMTKQLSGKLMVASASTCVELAANVQEGFELTTCPFLLMVAKEDVVVDNKGSEDLYERAKSEDKTMKKYPALHGLLCEPSPLVETIEKDMVDWIDSRAQSGMGTSQ